MFDYRTNRAVAAEGTFLTVVGSPTKAHADANRATATATATEERGSSNRSRHNVYIVWLTPKTKICEANAASDKSGGSRAKRRTLNRSRKSRR